MDLYQAIQYLYGQREKLERVIAALEELQKSADAPVPPKSAKRRGRTSMDAKERQEVSQRMKAYWTRRRQKSD
jgi:hypothetical protein